MFSCFPFLKASLSRSTLYLLSQYIYISLLYLGYECQSDLVKFLRRVLLLLLLLSCAECNKIQKRERGGSFI